MGCGIGTDYLPSQSAGDWVRYADHVVVASPVAEKDVDRRDYTSGPYAYRVNRLVTFGKVDLLWSRPRPRRVVGEGFGLVAAGWRVNRDGGARVEVLTPDAPRLETGHTYLLALRWDEGRWNVLGEGAAVPFDDHVAGRGEWCGRELREQDVALAERFSRQDDHSLEKAVVGKGQQAVVRELRQAVSRSRRE
ncbi:hypothetical protein ACIPPJ_33485 [Streptomyces sp. NPDC086091]|uniref:hypothetical protein n=1 Tax=Streptomyces sp. NPDC086091 TaxID=3365751 RepID=UPI0037FF5A74